MPFRTIMSMSVSYSCRLEEIRTWRPRHLRKLNDQQGIEIASDELLLVLP